MFGMVDDIVDAHDNSRVWGCISRFANRVWFNVRWVDLSPRKTAQLPR